MKGVLLIIMGIIGLFVSTMPEGKAAGAYVDSIRILPGTPTEIDIIRVAVHVSTSSGPSQKLSIVPTISPGRIDIQACYNTADVSAGHSYFSDTVLIGKLPEGKYYITVKAYYNLGYTNTNCDNIIDSSKRTDSFYVVPLMPATQEVLPINITEEDSIKIAVRVTTPNPARKISLSHTISQNDVLITGCFAKTQHIYLSQTFYDTLTIGKLLQGNYQSFVKVYYSEGDTNICDVVIDTTSISDPFTVAKVVSIKRVAHPQISIYPNPASERVLVSVADGGIIEQLILQDINGKTLRKEAGNSLGVAELPLGLYILQVQTNKGKFVHKFAKE